MIDVALNFVKRFLTEEITARATAGPEVVLSSLPKDPDDNTKDKIFITLLNIEEEKILRNFPAYTPDGGNATKINLRNAEIRLNLWTLFTAQFDKDRYESALKFISLVITIFQGKYVFEDTDFNTAEKDAGLEKLIIELSPPTFDQNNQIWQTLGSKLVPFILYRIRMVIIVDTEAPIIRSTNIIQGIDIGLVNK